MLRTFANILNYLAVMIGLLAFVGLLGELSGNVEDMSVSIIAIVFSLILITSGILNIIFISSVKPLDPEKEALKKEIELLKGDSQK